VTSRGRRPADAPARPPTESRAMAPTPPRAEADASASATVTPTPPAAGADADASVGVTAASPGAGATSANTAAPPAEPRAPDADPGLRLVESERELVGAEARAMAAALQEPERRAAFQRLAAEADEGLIPPALLGDLERLLEIGLQSGRFRGRYGPGGETAMGRLLARTPSGSEVGRRVAAANAALAALRGQRLEQLSISPVGWASYTLQLQTDGYTLRLRLDPSGAHAESLEAGG